ncbi:uncharacterized protein BX664DRAFT_313717 [Halteromyces radiatus]|uniref:uncharacterized protein n=1 Tax=Halteromyces radiatus TaxID=101107 RepID=UPI00221FC2DC|nr:uncharacterized protein BX664DRAFT_313717 [Halteromyces radiatus]KAI8093696.1 hypothetical protein BX664DRAFT_313717 [Halteromyces radiatus]
MSERLYQNILSEVMVDLLNSHCSKKFILKFFLMLTTGLALMISSSVFACDDACMSTGESFGKCNYRCLDACYTPAFHHRNEFLAGLQVRGYNCVSTGYDTLSCDSNGMGGCYGHKWTCGRNC